MKTGLCKILAALLILAALCTCACAEETNKQIVLKGYTPGGEFEYVELGYYPYTSTGSEEPVLWRVLSVSGDVALLRSEYAIDVYKGDKRTHEDQVLDNVCSKMLGTFMERGSVLTSSIPSEFDLNSDFYGYSTEGVSERRKVKVTPYSAANGVLMENGYAGYWTYKGRGMGYVTPNGGIISVSRPMKLGVVPMITASIGQLRLDMGSGTKEDPYRSSYSQRNLWFEKNMRIYFFEDERHINNPYRKDIPVYAGPGEDYYRPEGAVITKNETKVNVLAREGSWLLIEYMVTGEGMRNRTYNYKTGYVYEKNVLKKDYEYEWYDTYWGGYRVAIPKGQYDADALPYKHITGRTITETMLYDDRNLKSQPLYVLESDREVRILGHVEHNDILLAYVEADIYDQKARGFVRLEQLESDAYDIEFMTVK